jgi:hypothetical protein
MVVTGGVPVGSTNVVAVGAGLTTKVICLSESV